MSNSTKDIQSAFRERSDSVWQEVFGHPFVVGLGDGSLSAERIIHYLKQDYLYLAEFGKVYALASAKAQDLTDQRYFAELLKLTLDTEMVLHRRTCLEAGISAEELERTEPSLITTAYTSFLVRTSYEGSLVEILAATMPCASGYIEIALRLKDGSLPSAPFCRQWIEQYSSPEFQRFDAELKETFQRLSGNLPDEQQERLYRLYLTGARFELQFFEMAWRMDMWLDLSTL